MRRHWYFVSIWTCVICGRTRVTRERRYGSKPKTWARTHEYIENAACSGHFL
jgi:hypothetical protein